MASRRPSPLEPLKRLRDDRVDAAGRALAGTLREQARREEELAAQVAARARLAAADGVVRDDVRRALEEGTLRAGDVAQAARWQAGSEARAARAAAAEASARDLASTATGAVVTSRGEVARARADADAVQQLLTKTRAAERAKEEAAAEEAAEETFAARARRGAGS